MTETVQDLQSQIDQLEEKSNQILWRSIREGGPGPILFDASHQIEHTNPVLGTIMWLLGMGCSIKSIFGFLKHFQYEQEVRALRKDLKNQESPLTF